MIPLFFLMLFVYHSLFSLKVDGYLGLYPQNNTDEISMLIFAQYSNYVAAPLVYNYLQMMRRLDGTVFFSIMGNQNMVPVLGS